jgi:Sigma-70 region 2
MIACRPRSPDLCHAGTSDFRARDGAVHRRVEMISAGETEGALRHVLEAGLQRYHQESFGWALTCCRWVATEAEEVLQETYLKVLDGRARFDGRSHFKTWLFAVLRRTAAERRRKVHLWRVVPGSWWRSGPGAISVDPGVEMARQRATSTGRTSHHPSRHTRRGMRGSGVPSSRFCATFTGPMTSLSLSSRMSSTA